jgi:hypothetical protein
MKKKNTYELCQKSKDYSGKLYLSSTLGNETRSSVTIETNINCTGFENRKNIRNPN